MEPASAKQILAALADGVDPRTGEVLPAGSPLESPDVIRALHVAIAALDARARRSERESALPANAGKSWAPEDDQDLITAFDSGMSVNEMSRKFERTRGAITARLMRLGKITEREAAR